MDLFTHGRETTLRQKAPLADRMRPRTLDEFVGQQHIIGPGRLLRRAIQIDQLSSLIFYGPPGTGKTTLARIIANTTTSHFISINAVLAGVKDIRSAIETATRSLELYGRRTILFVDEVHRFNKAQQDALLPHVENGLVVLIGATTENPYFEVNKALVSRSRIFQLGTLTEDDLRELARAALGDPERGYGNREVFLESDALDHLVHMANGDARAVLNALELAVETTPPDAAGTIRIPRATIEDSIQRKAVLYDKDGDAHYDTISAFIKSVRGSDPDAALYWMARMVYAGEDPRFIFRRMLILACEDVGLAAPEALGVVMQAAQAFDYVGMPEGRYHLAHACLYLATAPKSNSSMAFFDALESVRNEAAGEVPRHLRDASRDAEGLGDGQGYLYPHAYRDHWVAQQYLPTSLMGKILYQPSRQGYESTINESVARKREAQLEAMAETDTDPYSCAGEPTQHSSGVAAWARRTGSGSGELLTSIRERLVEQAGITRQSLVLDLCARTGLLTLEAARITRGGGTVWSIVHDERSRQTLQALVGDWDELVRPVMVQGSWADFDTKLHATAGEGIQFDAIVARNALSSCPNKQDLLQKTVNLLLPGGCAAFADVAAGSSQRIYALIPPGALEPRLHQALEQVEEQLCRDPNNPRVGWDVSDSEQLCTRLDGCSTSVALTTEYPYRRVGRETIERWFSTNAQTPGALGKALAEQLGQPECERIRGCLLGTLAGRSNRWKTPVVYVRIRRNA